MEVYCIPCNGKELAQFKNIIKKTVCYKIPTLVAYILLHIMTVSAETAKKMFCLLKIDQSHLLMPHMGVLK